MKKYPILDPEQQKQADDMMWMMMKAGMPQRAFDYFKDTLFSNDKNANSHISFDRRTMIFYLFLQVGVQDFSGFDSPEELEELYYKIKFCLRRLDFDLAIEKQEEAWLWIRENQISVPILEGMIERDCIHKDMVRKKLEAGVYRDYPERESQEIPIESADKAHIFSFIMCVNQESWLEEVLCYLSDMEVPAGYAVEVIPVWDAESMASGYNRGMQQARGKYKIYMHQDVFIYNKNILQDILDTFRAFPNAGLLGVAGCTKMPEDFIWWDCEKKAKYTWLYQDIMVENQLSAINEDLPVGSPLLVLDGVLMVTSTDIPWREDLFHGFHFYDISQSMEFHRAGLDVIVPVQTEPWCLHEQTCNRVLDFSYEAARQSFIKEYGDELV